MDYEKFYSMLFKDLVDRFGPLDRESIVSIIGFSAGGPVNISKIDSKKIYVTCELADYKEQVKSSENLNYEFLAVEKFDSDWCRTVFTALAALGMEAELGDGHTVDISGVVEDDDPVKVVSLSLFSSIVYHGKKYGIYQVSNVR